MEVAGRIKLIMDTQTFDSGFQKREFVVTTKEQYPQDIKLECIKDRVELLDTVSPGEEVKVSFNLRGNEYNGRYYVNLQAWKIDKEGADDLTVNDINQEFQATGDAEDDLPF